MRPKKYEAEVEARKCEVEAEAKKNYVRPRPKHMRQLGKDESTVSNESCNIINFISHIIYHKTDISQSLT